LTPFFLPLLCVLCVCVCVYGRVFDPSRQGCIFSTRGGVTGYFADVTADDRVMGITEHGRPYGRVRCEGPPGVPAKAVKPGGDTQPPSGSSPTALLSVVTEEVAAQHSVAEVHAAAAARPATVESSGTSSPSDANRAERHRASRETAEAAVAARVATAAAREAFRVAAHPELVATGRERIPSEWKGCSVALLHVRSPHYTNVY
jgi:hypothetical protein